MEEHITETLIESPYPFWLTILLFSVISGSIQLIISFLRERGKNLATKKDISDITNKIESVKDSYNKALEAHKIELQKEFESHKYIMGLCHSLDETLLQHISSCLKAEAEKDIIEDCDNDESLLASNKKLSNFLHTYQNRYDSIPVLRKLRNISGDIDSDYMLFKFMTHSPINGEVNAIPSERKQQFINCLNESLMYFIPALVP